MLAQLRRDLTTLQVPRDEGMFRRLHGRLAMFRPHAVLDGYWTTHWKDETRRKRLLEKNRGRELQEYEPLLAAYAPREGLVIEAGCGLGQVVGALAERGYRVRGIEYDREVVAFVNQQFPQLDIVQGDVNALALADASVTTYISLGVIEHFVDGPGRALAEVRRVLTPDGHALISVPMLNVPRAHELAGLRDDDGADRDDLAFYQYYFSTAEMTQLMRDAGLAVVEWRGIFLESHLGHEHPLFARLWRSRLGTSRLRAPLRRAMERAPAWARRRYSHMAMFVCKRA